LLLLFKILLKLFGVGIQYEIEAAIVSTMGFVKKGEDKLYFNWNGRSLTACPSGFTLEAHNKKSFRPQNARSIVP